MPEIFRHLLGIRSAGSCQGQRAVALLRTIGHVLLNVDQPRSKELAAAAEAAHRTWVSDDRVAKLCSKTPSQAVGTPHASLFFNGLE
jgi:hypothetical protein